MAGSISVALGYPIARDRICSTPKSGRNLFRARDARHLEWFNMDMGTRASCPIITQGVAIAFEEPFQSSMIREFPQGARDTWQASLQGISKDLCTGLANPGWLLGGEEVVFLFMSCLFSDLCFGKPTV